MEIVINISEELYNHIKNDDVYYLEDERDLYRAVIYGIPLPKGHGRLVDADALEKKMCDREEELGDDKALWESSAVSVALDMFAPTIIEAEGSEKNECKTESKEV